MCTKNIHHLNIKHFELLKDYLHIKLHNFTELLKIVIKRYVNEIFSYGINVLSESIVIQMCFDNKT